MKLIRMRFDNGWLAVKAEVIGELAVYRLNGDWAVGHILSGAWVSGWTHKHVACNWARRMQSMFSFDYYWQSSDYEYRLMVSNIAKNYAKHPAYVRNCIEETVPFPDGTKGGLP